MIAASSSKRRRPNNMQNVVDARIRLGRRRRGLVYISDVGKIDVGM